jgi:hypothetical protein
MVHGASTMQYLPRNEIGQQGQHLDLTTLSLQSSAVFYNVITRDQLLESNAVEKGKGRVPISITGAWLASDPDKYGSFTGERLRSLERTEGQPGAST